MKTEEMLADRGSRYGNYLEQTTISGELRRCMDFWVKEKSTKLAHDQADSLVMIAVKISRIINGDPDYADNWRDIAGYATLVAERLEGKSR
jgi:hypothetical protein